VNDHALRVDEECLGQSVHAQIDADAPVAVECAGDVGITQALEPLKSIGALVFVVETVDGDVALGGDGNQHRVLAAAFHAPGGPGIEQTHLAGEILARQCLVRCTQLGEGKFRQGLAHQWRRYEARIKTQSDAQQQYQGDERTQW
jgi:hypothetical protein